MSLSVTSPVKIDQPSKLDLTFADPGALDTFRLVILWGDSDSTSVALGIGSRSFSTSHAFATAGVDTVTVIITDHGDGQATGMATVLVVAPAISLSAAPYNPAVPNLDFTTLAFFNSSTAKPGTVPASTPPGGFTLYSQILGQGMPSVKSRNGNGRSVNKPGGRGLQDLLALLLSNPPKSTVSHGNSALNSLLALQSGAAFSNFSAGANGAIRSNGPEQTAPSLAQSMLADEPQPTGGKKTRILMVIVWTLLFRNSRAGIRLGRRTLGELPASPPR